MIDAKRLFDAIRDIKGTALTQTDVDKINAIIEPVKAAPIGVPPHAKLREAILLAAIRSEAKWGIPASVTLAQFAVESAWGTRMPAGSNNPFGIKARVREGKVIDPYVSATTREENFGGQKAWVGKQPFRKFASFDEAFDEHGKLLATAGAYARARSKLPDANAFADALTGVYATDSGYGATLKSIMRTQGLYAYNGLAKQVAA
jgi:flagellum-specific peptidoglycan hydrolase FlgJ